MNKPLTFLLSLTFLFLFSGSVYGDDLQDGLDAARKGDYQTAYRLWLPLAEQGLAPAQFNLGHMYEKGQGIPQDYKEAVKWWRLAAKQGHVKAQVLLGAMYSLGKGVTQDDTEAAKWLRLAAEQGDTEAKGLLDLLSKAINSEKTAQLMQQARKAFGNKDYKKTLEIIKPLAEQGDARAQHLLGFMYDQGQGVPQDYKEAVKWFRLSAEQGDEGAQAKLGVLYLRGRGVPQDYVLAHMWFNLSGSNGIEDAEKLRNLIEKKMTPSQIEEAQRLARNWKPKK